MPRAKKPHLKRRKDGRYCCVYHGVQFMGNTEEEALQKREVYKQNEQREGFIRENPTVGQYAERWLPIAKAGISKAAYNSNVIHLSKLCAVIGNSFVKDVKATDIKKVYSTEYLTASGSYIKHAKAMFSAMFAAAVEDGLLRVNPAAQDSAKPHKGKDNSHRPITPDERTLIETVATDHPMHTAAIVMLYAGLRPQEVKALRVEDVDFDAGVIHVRSFVHMGGENHYALTTEGKTHNAVRDVPLFTPVRNVLKGKTGYLLPNKPDSIASKAAWYSAWISYRNKIERYLNGMQKRWYGKTVAHKQLIKDGKPLPQWKTFTVLPYDLRHSFCTWCRDNGVELHTCVEWMGHADSKMILAVYDAVTDSRSKREAERLEKMLFHRQNDMQQQEDKPPAVAPQGLTKD